MAQPQFYCTTSTHSPPLLHVVLLSTINVAGSIPGFEVEKLIVQHVSRINVFLRSKRQMFTHACPFLTTWYGFCGTGHEFNLTWAGTQHYAGQWSDAFQNPTVTVIIRPIQGPSKADDWMGVSAKILCWNTFQSLTKNPCRGQIAALSDV